ncbi:MAG: mycofactocin system transcriptional regulator [Sciscionella sp.]
MAVAPSNGASRGRKHSTSRAELEHVAFELFAQRGFEHTTVDEIATAAGIGRRTFFRYFASKNDVVWGDFDGALDRMAATLRAASPDLELMEVIRTALLEFNRVDPEEEPWLRRRMALILRVPALQAHSTLRYASWRAVLAEFAGEYLDRPSESLVPQAIAHCALGVAVAGYERWLADEQANLHALMDQAFRGLMSGFTDLGHR